MEENINIQRSFWLEEEQFKENVYNSLGAKLKCSSSEATYAKNYVETEAYEDKEAFVAHNALSHAQNNNSDMIRELAAVFVKPYFAHMKLRQVEDDSDMHVFLSDNADLNHVLTIVSRGRLNKWFVERR